MFTFLKEKYSKIHQAKALPFKCSTATLMASSSRIWCCCKKVYNSLTRALAEHTGEPSKVDRWNLSCYSFPFTFILKNSEKLRWSLNFWVWDSYSFKKSLRVSLPATSSLLSISLSAILGMWLCYTRWCVAACSHSSNLEFAFESNHLGDSLCFP